MSSITASKVRFLIDTNVLIAREDAHVLGTGTQDFLRAVSETAVQILIHPLSLRDLANDSDDSRRVTIMSKASTYRMLELPPCPKEDPEFLSLLSIQDYGHDVVDLALLHSVYRDAVHFLVTQDRRIHRRATKLGIAERVLTIDDAAQLLEIYRAPDAIPPSPLAIRKEPLHSLRLTDPFFDSLKDDYADFTSWFSRIAREGRMGWVYRLQNGGVGALLIEKPENEAIDGCETLPQKERLKICTLKVGAHGQHIGEFFLKRAIDDAVELSLPEVYLTHFTQDEDPLVQLIGRYGFRRVATNARGEGVYLKKLFPPSSSAIHGLTPQSINAEYYPSFVSGESTAKWIVPIRPQYYDRLFTDVFDRQVALEESAGKLIAEGNTIRKAYVCKSGVKSLAPGDVLLFYVSRNKVVRTLGTVDEVYTGVQSAQEVLEHVGTRTVYSFVELERIAAGGCLVILFLHHFHLRRPASLRRLREKGLLSHAPQSLSRLEQNQFLSILKEAGAHERLAIA